MECAQQTEDAGTAATSARERRGLRSVVVYTARLSLGDCTAGSAGTPTRTVELEARGTEPAHFKIQS
jgi:hypothetical protein